MRARAPRGFALMAALALLVLTSVVALELSTTARPPRLARATIAEQRAAIEAAVAGVEYARAILLGARADSGVRLGADAWSGRVGMTVGPNALGGLRYRIELHDANARLHINTATADQLRRLLLALHLDARQADRLAQAIADWRDADRMTRLNGAERAEYLRAGRVMLPDDAPFASVSTLRLVVGMTDSLYAAVRPHVTVIGSGRVNLNEADRPVLLALPGMTEESASLLLRERRAERRITSLVRFGDRLSSSARERWREAMPQLAALTVLETREMLVDVDAWRPDSPTRVHLDAIVSRDADGAVVWRRFSP